MIYAESPPEKVRVLTRIAFYAPLKPPTHPVPSGDREMARLLMRALERAGFAVTLASIFRSHDGTGDVKRQRRLETIGGHLARRLLRRHDAGASTPDLWFTYHPYHRAPDWIGPPVARALGIPYVVAEASVANKQVGGRWGPGHAATVAALGDAALALTINPVDGEGVARIVPAGRMAALPAFLDTGPFGAPERSQARALIAPRYGLDPALPWLVAVGMMRSRAKLASYEILGQALALLADQPWQLLAIGDGPARAEVAAALAPRGDRVRWAGQVAAADLPALLAAADIMVWPAIGEAYGMALLEGQAAGLPVVAGRSGGVPAIVEEGVSGILAAAGDAGAFAAALRPLLADPALRRRLGQGARAKAARHDIAVAAARLKILIEGVLP